MKSENVKYYVSEERLKKYRPYFPKLFNELSDAAKIIRESDEYLKFLEYLIDGLYGKLPDGFTFCEEEENIPLNFAPMFALLAHIEKCEEEVEKRNFDSEMRTKIFSKFESILEGNKKKYGFYGCTGMIYSWSKHYLKPDIFKIGTLEFEIRYYEWDNIYKDTGGYYIPLREESEGNGTISGISVKRGGNDGDVVSFKGYPVLLKGDAVISVHIPAKADITEETCCENYRLALQFFHKYYPEYSIKAFMCHSWLMDPQLSECLPKTSNILSFQKFFVPTCTKSLGEEVMTFIFGKRPKDLTTLPENTTLTKNLKKRYLENNPIYAHIGIHLLEE